MSIVVPCFNQAQYLGDAVESIVAQTCPDWEAILIDDGSTDHTPEVIAQWTKRDPRFVAIRQANRGLARTRNRGIDTARGRYLQFLDADDVIFARKLEIQTSALLAAAVPAVSICGYGFGDGDNVWESSGGDGSRWLLFDAARALEEIALRWETEVSIPIHSYLFDMRLISAGRVRFDANLPNHEDWDFIMTILRSRPPILRADERLAIYRYQRNSMSRNLPRMRAGFLAAIAKQRRAFAADPGMSRIMREKDRITREYYRSVSPWNRFRRAALGLLPEFVRTPLKRVRDRCRPAR